MKTPTARIFVVTALGVAAGLGLWLAFRPESPVEAVMIAGDFQKLLDRQPIAELNLQNASLNQAIAVLNQSLAKRPETAGLRVALWTAPTPPAGYHRRERPVAVEVITVIRGLVEPEAPSLPAPLVRPEEATLNLRLVNVPFTEALSYVANLSDRVAARMGDTLYLVEKRGNEGTFGPMTERTLTSPATLPEDPREAKEVLRKSGVIFYEGSEVRLIAPHRLLIRDVQEEMDQIDVIVGFDLTLRERVESWFAPLRYVIENKFDRPAPSAPSPSGTPGFLPEPTAVPVP